MWNETSFPLSQHHLMDHYQWQILMGRALHQLFLSLFWGQKRWCEEDPVSVRTSDGKSRSAAEVFSIYAIIEFARFGPAPGPFGPHVIQTVDCPWGRFGRQGNVSGKVIGHRNRPECLSVRPSLYPSTNLCTYQCTLILSVCLSICRSISPMIGLSIRPSICQHAQPTVHPSVQPSNYLSVSRSVCLSVYPSIHLCICLSVCLSVCCLLIHLPIHISIHP